MLRPVFGTAHLYGLVDAARSTELLTAAAHAGFEAFDTAPSYGFGQSEPAVGELIRHASRPPAVTTKVGIVAVTPPSTAKRWVKAAARQLPGPVQQKLRGAGATAGPASHGHFGLPEVRASIELSLQRLGHLDRLMLHEAQPADVTDELVAALVDIQARGDIGTLGIATSNQWVAACVARAPAVFTAVHFAAGPLATPVELGDSVTVRVGHGLLGNGGADVAALQSRLAADAELADRWRAATADTPWQGAGGLAALLLARGAASGVTDVIVSTSRTERVAGLRQLLTEPAPISTELAALLAELIAPLAVG